MALFRRRIRRTREGGYEVRLPERERELVAQLVDELRQVLLVTTDHPTVRRLFPTAYNEDAERDREYQQLVRDELLERRLAALATVEETLADGVLTEEALTGWLTALNDLRLALGTALDVTEDLLEVDPDDPNVVDYAVYEYLGLLLSEVVDALGEGLPPPSDEDPLT